MSHLTVLYFKPSCTEVNTDVTLDWTLWWMAFCFIGSIHYFRQPKISWLMQLLDVRTTA